MMLYDRSNGRRSRRGCNVRQWCRDRRSYRRQWSGRWRHDRCSRHRLRFYSIFLRHPNAGAERVACLLQRNGLGQHKAGAQPKSVGYARFSFHDGDSNRILVQVRGTGAVEDLGGILRVVAIDDQQVETLRPQALESERGLAGVFKGDFQFVQDLSNSMDSFFVTAQQKGPSRHNSLMVRSWLLASKLLR